MAADRTTYDVIVIGLGAMGSGASCELARRGKKVLGLDRYRPPHVHGSSHGQTRVIRETYGDDARYVPLVRRTFDGWRRLEADTGQELLVRAGLVLMGRPETELIRTTLSAAAAQGTSCERLDHGEIHRRWPALRTEPTMCGILDSTAGALRVEPCIEALLAEAARSGAVLNFDEPVDAWTSDGAGFSVTTDRDTYRAEKLVIAAGPWCTQLVAELAPSFWVERQVQFWFEPASNAHLLGPDRCPLFAWEHEGGVSYGFPDFGHGVKVAHHHGGRATDPDRVGRDIDEQDVESMRTVLHRFLPDANGKLTAHDVCLYTNTPDLNFLIDTHPDHDGVVIVGGCSGHGFKFAPVVGEIVADLVDGRRDTPNLDMFGIGRLL